MKNEIIESTDIAIIVRDNPGIVLFDQSKYDEFYQRKKTEVEAFVPDITTESGRKAIASLAYSVAQEKSKLDKAGKAAKEQALLTCQKVDEARRKITADFDALRDQARKPLDDWESANKAREEKAREIIATLNASAIVPMDATVESVNATLEAIRLIDTASLQEFAATAEAAKRQAFTSLTTALQRLNKEAQDRAELERLRAERETRIAAEQEASRLREEQRLKAEAEELARFAEEARQKAEQARIEQARKDAEESARLAAEKAAREAAEKIEREHAAELAKLKEESDRKERERQAELNKARKAQEEAEEKQRREAKRVADAEAARLAEEARLKKIADAKAEADRKLAANKKHRQELMTASKLALIQCGITEEQAVNVVKAIVAKTIPSVEFRWVP